MPGSGVVFPSLSLSLFLRSEFENSAYFLEFEFWKYPRNAGGACVYVHFSSRFSNSSCLPNSLPQTNFHSHFSDLKQFLDLSFLDLCFSSFRFQFHLRSSISGMAASLVGGAALGALFGELLKAVSYAKQTATKFQSTLENLTKTLLAIRPLIEEIQQHNYNLDRPKEELEPLIRDMEECKKLVDECSKISRRDIYRRLRYQKQLAALAKSLERFFKIDMQPQIARDLKEALIKKDPFEPRKITAFEGRLKENNSDLGELLRAATEFLGKTNYGCSHKASLKDGTALVVKRLKNTSVGKEEFERQMEIAHKLSQHPNVMPLRAWYCSHYEQLLICDYMAAGSLSTLLHGIREGLSTQLGWDSRMKILLGIAKGIAHIHSANGGQFSHGIITSSNVLLTVDLQVRISDHAIPSVVSVPIFLHGKDCYNAPEVIKTKEVTQKSDVYSFGILLLEMLTIESPLDEDFRSSVQSEAVADDMYVRHLWKLAESCVGEHPELRPSMDEVVREMEEITS